MAAARMWQPFLHIKNREMKWINREKFAILNFQAIRWSKNVCAARESLAVWKQDMERGEAL